MLIVIKVLKKKEFKLTIFNNFKSNKVTVLIILKNIRTALQNSEVKVSEQTDRYNDRVLNFSKFKIGFPSLSKESGWISSVDYWK